MKFILHINGEHSVYFSLKIYALLLSQFRAQQTIVLDLLQGLVQPNVFRTRFELSFAVA